MTLEKTPGNSRELICANCNKTFRKLNMDYNKAIRNGQTDFYCSRQCKPSDKYSVGALKRYHDIGSYVLLECDNCLKLFERCKSTFRKWVIEHKVEKYCSSACSIESRSKERRGEKSQIRLIAWKKIHKNITLPSNQENLESECWIWNGSYSGDYGVFHWPIRKGMRAHRAMFELYYRPIKEELIILHSCDNKKCVNPFHLEEGTYKKNSQDAYDRGRRKAPCAKLTEEDVLKIRELFATGQYIKADLAQMFGVSVKTIQRVVNYKYWRKVQKPQN